MGEALVVISSIIEEGVLMQVIDNVNANLEITSVIANESAQILSQTFEKNYRHAMNEINEGAT